MFSLLIEEHLWNILIFLIKYPEICYTIKCHKKNRINSSLAGFFFSNIILINQNLKNRCMNKQTFMDEFDGYSFLIYGIITLSIV